MLIHRSVKLFTTGKKLLLSPENMWWPGVAEVLIVEYWNTVGAVEFHLLVDDFYGMPWSAPAPRQPQPCPLCAAKGSRFLTAVRNGDLSASFRSVPSYVLPPVSVGWFAVLLFSSDSLDVFFLGLGSPSDKDTSYSSQTGRLASCCFRALSYSLAR